MILVYPSAPKPPSISYSQNARPFYVDSDSGIPVIAALLYTTHPSVVQDVVVNVQVQRRNDVIVADRLVQHRQPILRRRPLLLLQLG